eukprot:TRINITY_DN508_c0_g4_i3.p1 TRINITY_DN508_c0_g4~~TRINITY_DN508_c0_g4_i3.p1  ORF type:complete len:857 (-),score=247.66 TRINITY_DN508_c0_g4_i3:70-2529(-)
MEAGEASFANNAAELPAEEQTADEQHNSSDVAPAKHNTPKGPPKACLFIASVGVEADEQSLLSIFGKYGTILSLKLLKDRTARPYAFVQYAEVESANNALDEVNGQEIGGRRVRVEVAKVNRTLFVAKMARTLTADDLREIAEPYGPLESVTIIKNHATQTSKGCGFLKYEYREDALDAASGLRSSQRKWVVEWANNNNDPATVGVDKRNVFVGNLNPTTTTKESLEERFKAHGDIESITLVDGKSNAKAGANGEVADDAEKNESGDINGEQNELDQPDASTENGDTDDSATNGDQAGDSNQTDTSAAPKRDWFAFVLFVDDAGSASAIEAENGTDWNGRTLRVQYCESQEIKNRRRAHRHVSNYSQYHGGNHGGQNQHHHHQQPHQHQHFYGGARRQSRNRRGGGGNHRNGAGHHNSSANGGNVQGPGGVVPAGSPMMIFPGATGVYNMQPSMAAAATNGAAGGASPKFNPYLRKGMSAEEQQQQELQGGIYNTNTFAYPMFQYNGQPWLYGQDPQQQQQQHHHQQQQGYQQRPHHNNQRYGQQQPQAHRQQRQYQRQDRWNNNKAKRQYNNANNNPNGASQQQQQQLQQQQQQAQQQQLQQYGQWDPSAVAAAGLDQHPSPHDPMGQLPSFGGYSMTPGQHGTPFMQPTAPLGHQFAPPFEHQNGPVDPQHAAPPAYYYGSHDAAAMYAQAGTTQAAAAAAAARRGSPSPSPTTTPAQPAFQQQQQQQPQQQQQQQPPHRSPTSSPAPGSGAPGLTGGYPYGSQSSASGQQSTAPGNAPTPVANTATPATAGSTTSTARSEERRVGKECRSRWSPYH